MATKVLRERYKTYDGADRRMRFENGIARHEYERGYKARLYKYTVTKDADGSWRVVRELNKAEMQGSN